MRYPHYSLLSLEIRKDDTGKTQPILTGPLALVAGDEIESHQALLASLGALARLKPNRRIELLGLRCGFDGEDHFTAEADGPFARVIGKKVAEGMEKAINRKCSINRPIAKRSHQRVFTMYQPPYPSTAGMKMLAARLKFERTGRPIPSTATLQITGRCQANCYHCSAARHQSRIREELTTDQAKHLIRQTEQLGVANIVFTGGEPMLRKDIFELIAYVDKDEANAMMFSNGLLLSPESVQKLKDAGLFSINVSIDSPDPAEHNALRRVPDCFETAVDGMKRIIDAGILCGISTYASPERLRNGKVRELIELAKSIGCHEITIFDTVPTGKLLREDEHILLSDNDKEEIIRMEQEINARDDYPHIISQAFINGPRGSGCFAAWFQFYMTAYGDIMPCDFTPLSFGNIKEEPLADIWDRMISHEAYSSHCNHCRMQDPEFRARWIDVIPNTGPFPYPAVRIQPGVMPEGTLADTSVEQEHSSVGIRA